MDKENEHKIERFKSIVIDDTKYKTQLTSKYVNRQAWEKPNETKVIAFIPGTIVKIFVKEKQKLKKGTRILVFEAMKMKNNVFIHRDGVIKKIYIKEGDRVTKGMLMVELESKTK